MDKTIGPFPTPDSTYYNVLIMSFLVIIGIILVFLFWFNFVAGLKLNAIINEFKDLKFKALKEKIVELEEDNHQKNSLLFKDYCNKKYWYFTWAFIIFFIFAIAICFLGWYEIGKIMWGIDG